MKISLLTDAPNHNLALMKMSAWFKMNGDEIRLNMPLWKANLTYGSWLFVGGNKYPCDIEGGPGVNIERKLDPWFEWEWPDYDLYPIDYSLGFTWRYCPRRCPFCVVPRQMNEKIHLSIYKFHRRSTNFKTICLLNNNTFSDPEWKKTFEEIWDADLILRDENGYDLRLVDQEKAEALAKTRWDHGPKFAWDRMEDETGVMRGLEEINRAGIKWTTIYVLMGFDTTIEEDIYRCQKIHDMGHNPFPMIYEDDGEKPQQHNFRRMIYARYYKKSGNIEKAWGEYTRK